MREIQRVLMAGNGAVGAAVAARIDTALPGAITVLADSERAERYRREGFLVNGLLHRFAVAGPRPQAVGVCAGEGCFDLVILAVKFHHLPDAMAQLQGWVGPETTVLSLLNGITSEDLLGKAFGPGPGAPEGATIPPYAMIIGIDAVRQGNETRYTQPGIINFGDTLNPAGAWSPRVARLARFFDRARLAYEVPGNMRRALWFKYMVNIGINQASAVLAAPYRLFQTDPHARAVVEAAMREVIALSRTLGIGLDEGDLRKWDNILATLNPEAYTSMCQDVMASRKTEVEMLGGTMVELGRRHGVATPTNQLFLDLILAIEAGYGIRSGNGRPRNLGKRPAPAPATSRG
jgi:2-dehydropantoate 2-reductase